MQITATQSRKADDKVKTRLNLNPAVETHFKPQTIGPSMLPSIGLITNEVNTPAGFRFNNIRPAKRLIHADPGELNGISWVNAWKP